MRMEFTWHGCDSALAAPLVLDLARLTAAAHRAGRAGPLTELAFFFKDPLGDVPHALAEQWALLRALRRTGSTRCPPSWRTSPSWSARRPRCPCPATSSPARRRPARSARRTPGAGRRLGLLYWAGHGRQRLGRPRAGRRGAPGAADPVSGRVAPATALGVAAGLTAAGVALAAAGRRPPGRSPSRCRWPARSGRTTCGPRTPRRPGGDGRLPRAGRAARRERRPASAPGGAGGADRRRAHVHGHRAVPAGGVRRRPGAAGRHPGRHRGGRRGAAAVAAAAGAGPAAPAAGRAGRLVRRPLRRRAGPRRRRARRAGASARPSAPASPALPALQGALTARAGRRGRRRRWSPPPPRSAAGSREGWSPT